MFMKLLNWNRNLPIKTKIEISSTSLELLSILFILFGGCFAFHVYSWLSIHLSLIASGIIFATICLTMWIGNDMLKSLKEEDSKNNENKSDQRG